MCKAALVCRSALLAGSFLLGSQIAAAAADAGPALTQETVARLALSHQPLLEAGAATIRAAQASAVAASQLPDPKFSLGLSDLTIEGSDGLSLTRESDTQFTAGISQDFPRAEKRRLRGERGTVEVGLRQAELATRQREIARDAQLAFLDLWRADQALALTQAAEKEAGFQLEAERLRYASGGSNRQADVVAAELSLELMRDQVASMEQEIAHYRNTLSRWIGDAAYGPVSSELALATPPDAEQLIATLQAHPHVLADAQKVKLEETNASLARQDYKADYSIEAGYGYRPAFADYASVRISFELPAFTKNRQDQRLQAALAGAEAARAQLEDSLREHRAQIRLNSADWQSLQVRLARYRTVLLPDAQKRIDSALVAYGAGASELNSVLMARRTALDVRLAELSLRLDAAKHTVQLAYFFE